RIPSISTLPERREDCLRNARWLGDRFDAMGMKTQIVDVVEGGLPVVIADWQGRPGKPHLTMYGHYDVQPVDPVDGWKSPPFEPAVHGRPTLATALRGLLYTELRAKGPAVDLHSGTFGGVAPNPINTLARVIGELKDRHGHVTIPGFYDAVRPPSAEELAAWKKNDARYVQNMRRMTVAKALEGEEDFLAVERTGSRPTLDANGFIGGFTGKGAKTVIPAEASAKVSMRLVPDQDWQAILPAFKRRVSELTTPGVEISVEVIGSAPPVTC